MTKERTTAMAIDAKTIERIIEHARQACESPDPKTYMESMPLAERDEFESLASDICNMSAKLILNNQGGDIMVEAYDALRRLRASGIIEGKRIDDFRVGDFVTKDSACGYVVEIDKSLGCLDVSWEGHPPVSEQAAHIRLGNQSQQVEEADTFEAIYSINETAARQAASSMPVVMDAKLIAGGLSITVENEDQANKIADQYGMKLLEVKKKIKKAKTLSFTKNTEKKSDEYPFMTNQDAPDSEIQEGANNSASGSKIREAYDKALAKPVYRGVHADNTKFNPAHWNTVAEMFSSVREMATYDSTIMDALNEAASAYTSGVTTPVQRLAEQLGAEKLCRLMSYVEKTIQHHSQGMVFDDLSSEANLSESTTETPAEELIAIEEIAPELRNVIRDTFAALPGASIQEAEEIARMAVSDGIINLCVSNPERAVEKISETFMSSYGKPPTFARMAIMIAEAVEKSVPKGKKLRPNRTVQIHVARQPAQVTQGEEQVVSVDALKQLDDMMTSIQSSSTMVKQSLDNRRANRNLATDILAFYNLLSLNQGEPWNPVRMRQQESIGDWSGVLELEAIQAQEGEEEDENKPEEKAMLAVGFVKPAKAAEKQGDGEADKEKIEELRDHIRRIKTHVSSLLGNPRSRTPVRNLLVALRRFFQFLVANEKQPWNTLFKVSA